MVPVLQARKPRPGLTRVDPTAQRPVVVLGTADPAAAALSLAGQGGTGRLPTLEQSRALALG